MTRCAQKLALCLILSNNLGKISLRKKSFHAYVMNDVLV